MTQTAIVLCPKCERRQLEDIYGLTMDTGEMEGSFSHVCENCDNEFLVDFIYKPYVKTYKEDNQ